MPVATKVCLSRQYHWRVLPQVSLLSRIIIFFVATNMCLSRQTHVCRDKKEEKKLSRDNNVVVTIKRLSRQNSFFFFLSRRTSVCGNIVLSPQTFCRDKHTFVASYVAIATKSFVETKNNNKTNKLSRQKSFLRHFPPVIRQNVCGAKIMFVATNICRDKRFLPTNTCLSRQSFKNDTCGRDCKASRGLDFKRARHRLLI